MDVKINLSPKNVTKRQNTLHIILDRHSRKQLSDSSVNILNNSNQLDIINNVIYSPGIHSPTRKPRPKYSNKTVGNILHKKYTEIKDELSKPDITKHLIQLGYRLEGVKHALSLYNFKNLEQAIYIMGMDNDTGLYNHKFIPMLLNEEYKYEAKLMENNGKICNLCGDISTKHPMDMNALFEQAVPLERNISFLSPMKTFLSEYKPELVQTIPAELIARLELQFAVKENLCRICFAEEMYEENSKLLDCGHMFCMNCLRQYIETLINEAKVTSIVCLQAGCGFPLIDSVIMELVDDANYVKYKRFKKRLIYLTNINIGLIPCIFPDCEEWIAYKDGDEPLVACEYNHKFCAKCKQKWHVKGRCRNVNKK
jgi:hypothetical protein